MSLIPALNLFFNCDKGFFRVIVIYGFQLYRVTSKHPVIIDLSLCASKLGLEFVCSLLIRSRGHISNHFYLVKDLVKVLELFLPDSLWAIRIFIISAHTSESFVLEKSNWTVF